MKTEDPARLAQTSRLVFVFAIRTRLKVHFHVTAVSEMLCNSKYVMSTKSRCKLRQMRTAALLSTAAFNL